MMLPLIVSIYVIGCIIVPYLLGRYTTLCIKNEVADIAIIVIMVIFWPMFLFTIVFGKRGGL